MAEKEGEFLRIQVKSTARLDSRGRSCYQVTCRKNRGRYSKQRYVSGDFDYLLAYVAPEDSWYVLPLSAIRGTKLVLYPHRTDMEGQYEKFKEAWKLLDD